MKEFRYCFYSLNADLELAIAEIGERIPCLTEVNFWYTPDDEVRVTLLIRCREQDAAFVERMLAPFV